MNNNCPNCGVNIDTFHHADNCAFKKPEYLAELDGERQMTAGNAPTIEEQIAGLVAFKTVVSLQWKDEQDVEITLGLLSAAIASLEKLAALESQQERSADGPCKDSDGCPTERAEAVKVARDKIDMYSGNHACANYCAATIEKMPLP